MSPGIAGTRINDGKRVGDGSETGRRSEKGPLRISLTFCFPPEKKNCEGTGTILTLRKGLMEKAGIFLDKNDCLGNGSY